MKSNNEYWDKIFHATDEEKLGWYEQDVSTTLNLLSSIPKWKEASIFLPGVGTSTLIDELLKYDIKLTVNDISIEALNLVKSRVGDNKLLCLCQDISKSIADDIEPVDIWIDRAVLHFLRDEDDIKGYFENLKSKLKEGGYAIFAEFSKKGALTCAGLELHRYSVEELTEQLGISFRLIEHFDYEYINPNGDTRPYIYALYKRDSTFNSIDVT